MLPMATIAHLHWLPIEAPSNGTETRIRKTAEYLTTFGTVLSIHPCVERREITDGLYAVPIENPLLSTKLTRIELWYAAMSLGASNPYHQLQSALTTRHVRGLDDTFDLVISEGPQMTTAAFDIAATHGAPVLLNKHNAMYALLDQLLADSSLPRRITQRAVDSLRRFEQTAIDRADAVVFQSEADRELFTIPSDTRVATIPNGTDHATIQSGGSAEQLCETYGLSPDDTHVVFIGSYEYLPNREVAETIATRVAPQLHDVEFLLVGRDPPELPDLENVHTLGFVEDLPGVLAMADIAICPLERGRGTKLKMMDYLAAGLPIVTTSVGAEGIDVTDGESVLIRDDSDGLVEAIAQLAADERLRTELGAAAAITGAKYAWPAVLADYDPLIHELLGTDREPIPA